MGLVVHRQMSLAYPLRGRRLASQYTPGVTIASELLGIPAGNSLPQTHNGEIQYQYQSRFISWMTLQLAPPKPSDQHDSLL